MKTFVVCLSFTQPHITHKSLERCRETFGKRLYELILVDQHYPLQNKNTNSWILSAIASQLRANLIRPYKNLGLHGGGNWAIAQCEMKDEDIYIGLDHDAWPDKPGWGDALLKVMEDEQIASCSLWNDHAQNCPGRQWDEMLVNGERVFEDPKNFGVNGLTAYRVGDVRRAGGFQEPCAYYGHIEQWMWQEWKKMGKRHVYAADFKDDLTRASGHDDLFTQYKIEHAHKMSFNGSFEEWLKANGHIT